MNLKLMLGVNRMRDLVRTIRCCIRYFGFKNTLTYIDRYIKNEDETKEMYDSLQEYLKDEINYGVEE